MSQGPPLGSHMSIAGGYYRAVTAAATAGCDCVQLFTKNNNQWNAKPLTADDGRLFREELAKSGIAHPLSHASYLINLASPDDELRIKSQRALEVELERAAVLGIPYVVVHPGAFTTSSAEDGIAAIQQSVTEILSNTQAIATGILLENTAGQGSTLGWQLEQLGAMLQGVAGPPERLGVCLDTCHAFAAGYNLSDAESYEAFHQELARYVGLDRVKAWHLNDSLKPLGSRVDRHAHIGHGCLGLEAFRHLLNDVRWQLTPMYLETEKGVDDSGEDWDVVNLRQLRALRDPAALAT